MCSLDRYTLGDRRHQISRGRINECDCTSEGWAEGTRFRCSRIVARLHQVGITPYCNFSPIVSPTPNLPRRQLGHLHLCSWLGERALRLAPGELTSELSCLPPEPHGSRCPNFRSTWAILDEYEALTTIFHHRHASILLV